MFYILNPIYNIDTLLMAVKNFLYFALFSYRPPLLFSSSLFSLFLLLVFCYESSISPSFAFSLLHFFLSLSINPLSLLPHLLASVCPLSSSATSTSRLSPPSFLSEEQFSFFLSTLPSLYQTPSITASPLEQPVEAKVFFVSKFHSTQLN